MKLKELREERGLTQREVSHMAGIPYNTYRRYEYGETEPTLGAVERLARAYRMTPGELVDLILSPL